ncbi:uncharacterized protein CIMG_03011 [Coccidioides immitis RS]|uniref:Uncharacterized protein n=1 Tax=Coccidioides immitis (strain RS) TaxID=246410 RepID=J3KAE8_COCIM|nr:uncharacterized protein CIMG_03011 [Coccidioides immitis RS]EAS31987.3 hypothetical protein CIMG_03011 [Coccidioides immitis RS]
MPSACLQKFQQDETFGGKSLDNSRKGAPKSFPFFNFNGFRVILQCNFTAKYFGGFESYVSVRNFWRPEIWPSVISLVSTDRPAGGNFGLRGGEALQRGTTCSKPCTDTSQRTFEPVTESDKRPPGQLRKGTRSAIVQGSH